MATRPSYFRERARNPYLRARPPAPGLEEEDPNASPLAPTFPRAMPFQPEVVARPDMPASFLGPLLAGGGLPGGERATVPGMPAPAPEPTPAPPSVDMERAAYMAQAPTTTKGKILQALGNAGLGFLQSAARDPNNPIAAGLGGAAAGGLISGISPRTGRAYQFETIQRPGIEERIRAEEEKRKRARQAEQDALNEEYRRAQIGELGSRSEIARENTRRQSVVAQSQVDLNSARAEAARTGNPSYVDIDEGGKITKYQVFPNGMMRPVGMSGAAAISRANIKSREGIAARREAGANARAARRQTEKTRKVATIDDIDDAVKASGLSELEVKKRFIEKGYRIIEE